MEQNYLLFMNRNNNSRNNNISQVNFHSYQDESNEDKNNILISSKLDADESNPKIIDNFESLKYLLSTPLLIGNDILKENKRKLTLIDFHKKNINKLKEDLAYYFLSPESISRFKTSFEAEIDYELFKDLDSENFILAQEERFKHILSISKADSDSSLKKNKPNNFDKNFCYNTSLIQNKEQYYKQLIKANLIEIKMNEFFYLNSRKNINEEKIITYLDELKDIIFSNNINLEELGLIHFNSIENILISILNLIEIKLEDKKRKEFIMKFCFICIKILQIFKSTKLYFFVILFLKQNKDIIDFNQIDIKKELKQLIPNNCFDFRKLNKNINNILIKDLGKSKSVKRFIQNISNANGLNLEDYRTLCYYNYLFLFICFKGNSFENIYFYFKIDLINEKIIDEGNIILFDKVDEKTKNVMNLDINFTMRNEFIYIFYIMKVSENYSLKCKLYNEYKMHFVEEIEIELIKSFVPMRLYNDNKYIFCVSNGNKILMIKINKELEPKRYINCSFKLFEKDLIHYKEIKDLSSYEMNNSLCIHNLFFINDINEKNMFLAKLIINENDNFTINLYEMVGRQKCDESLKITYNNNRFIITKISKEDNKLFYNMTTEDYNQLIDKGISLLPFNSNISNYNSKDNIFEYMLQEYSTFLNLCGNFELINSKNEKCLMKYPFSLCCHFDPNFCNFIIDDLIKNEYNDQIKLNYIIILKQIICQLYMKDILKEEIIKEIIPYFKKLIFDKIHSKETKLFNKILREIVKISKYLQNNIIIEFDEIKFILDKNFNIKTKLLLIELLIKQNFMQNHKGFYETIIKLEKNYLIDIFNSNSNDLSKYYLFQKLMIEASEHIYKNIKNIKNILISLLFILSENIQILLEYYNKSENNNKNENLKEPFFLYNSFNFRCFYLIIEYLLTNKIFLEKKEYIITIYKTLLLFDKKNINYNKYLDMNNVVEITNYSFYNEDEDINDIDKIKDNRKVIVTFGERKNIIIKTNLLSHIELFNSIDIEITNKNRIFPVFLNKCKDNNIYYNVERLKIIFKKMKRNFDKYDFIIHIIPLKDTKLFELYEKDKDFIIISLIEKSIIHYLLNSFEGINSHIKKYNDKLSKEFSNIFQSELFKFLSIPKDLSLEKYIKSNSQSNDTINKSNEKLDELIMNTQFFNSLSDELNKSFNAISKNISTKESVYEPKNENFFYDKQKINIKEEKEYDEILKIFKYDLSTKNIIANSIKENDKINLLIKGIFLFGIKYYNLYMDLNSLVMAVMNYNVSNIKDIKNNIENIRKLDNYLLFFSFYKESFHVVDIFHKYKNKFDPSIVEEEKEKFLLDNLKKIEFLHNNIIPYDDLTIKPNTFIIKNLLEVIEYSNIGIYEITQYLKIKNVNSQIKLIELTIINNLLLYLNDESNISLILTYICKSNKNSHNKLNSIFDKISDVYYYDTEKFMQNFHFFLQILSSKLKDNQNKYSNATQILIIECLIWKIKKRNFPILLEILKIFEEIKNEKIKNNIDVNLIQFKDENDRNCYNNIYNVQYLNNQKKMDYMFDAFKILVYQIINIIKHYLKYKNKNDNDLTFSRTSSSLSKIEFETIFEEILSYFIDIDDENAYYKKLVLFFYKLFNNSHLLLNYILQKHPLVIKKIIEISYANNIFDTNTWLIMIKLLCQIIENITEDNLEYLSKCIPIFDNINFQVEKPLIYLYEKLLNNITDNYLNFGIEHHKYFVNLIYICINKIFELEKDKKTLLDLASKKNFLKLILLNDNYYYIYENQFFIKSNNNSNRFEDLNLFNSIDNKSIKTGKILYFLDTELYEYINTILAKNYENLSNSADLSPKLVHAIPIRDNKHVLIIMENFEQLVNYNIYNFEIKDISELEIINTKNKYKLKFIENNSKSIMNSLKDELISDKLNEKGIFLILKILSELIKYLDKDNLLFLFKYLIEFYNANQSLENNYPFMSIEYIEKEINQFFLFNNFKNIYKEKVDINKSSYPFFSFKIKNHQLEINKKLEYINDKRFNLLIPYNIREKIKNDENINKLYDTTYESLNLSFYNTIYDKTYKKLEKSFYTNKIYNSYKSELLYELDKSSNEYSETVLSAEFDDDTNNNEERIEIIKENSILLVKSILTDNDLSEISELLKKNMNKIKAIIVERISYGIDTNKLINFINQNSIPIFEVYSNLIKKLSNFFIKGIGINYIFLYKNEHPYFFKDNSSLFNIYKSKIDNKSVDQNINSIEYIVITMSEKLLNKIKNNPSYKINLCKESYCILNMKCEFAHGNEEKESIKKIREYLINKDIKEERHKICEENRKKIYNEIKDESKDLFNIINLKLSKRLILDILCRNIIEFPEDEKLFQNILYIYEVLWLEYYFNSKHNLYNISLKNNLLNYIKKFLNEKEVPLSKNKWILNCFKRIEKNNESRQIFNLENISIIKLNNEKKLYDQIYCGNDIIFNILLFAIDLINKRNNNNFFIQHYFNIINNRLESIIKNNLIFNNKHNYCVEGNEYLLLTKIMDIIYNYYSNEIKNNDIRINNEIITNNFKKLMEKLNQINLNDYLPYKNNKKNTQFLINNNNNNQKMHILFLIEFIFKFLELNLILLFKYNQIEFYNYMKSPDNHIFKYFTDYKILTMEKYNNNSDYKENVAFIYYLIELISSQTTKINELKYKEKILDVTVNHINEYKFQYISDFYDVTFSQRQFKNNNNKDNYNKILVFCLDDENKKYYLQNIIDFSNHLSSIYKMRVNKNMYIVPLKIINTCLYSIENIINSPSTKIKDIKLMKFEDTPKYSWNIGFDGNKYFILSEENNLLYSFIESNNDIESIKDNFKKHDNIYNISDNIVDFIDGVENYPSFAYTEKGEIYILGEVKSKYTWLNAKEKTNITSPIYIPNVQIKYISANYNQCYAIGKDGNLYENMGKDFIKLDLPKGIKKFLLCACGDDYVICLGENNIGKGVIFAKGSNKEYQCGIDNSNFLINELTKCELDDDLDFKYICTYKGFSAALTSCGKLYVWGVKFRLDSKLFYIESPKLINENQINPIIVDTISLNHNYLYAIGRELQNGYYIKKLFLLEDNCSNSDKIFPFYLNEINIIDKDDINSRIIPIKIFIGQNRTYLLTINETKLIEEIIQNDIKNDINETNKILINYNVQNIKEEYSLETLKKVYFSNQMNTFIESFNSLSDEDIKEIRKVFNILAKGNYKINNIDYKEFISYLNENKLNNLILLFSNKEKNEGKILFTYFKKRISLIDKNIMNYLYLSDYLTNLGFIQKIVERNYIYLNVNFRLQYFLTFLDNYNYKKFKKRKVIIDRFSKATKFKEQYNENKIPDINLTETEFGQLFQCIGDLVGKKFLIAKDEKLFYVKFKEEKGIDAGGLYNEVISDICEDLQSDYLELFIKTPNNKNRIGDLMDNYIVNPNCKNIIYQKGFEFIGKLMALAISSSEVLNLNLHPIVWKSLSEEKITFEEFRTIDINFYNFIMELKEAVSNNNKKLFDDLNFSNLTFVIQNFNDENIELIENGKDTVLSLENAELFINSAVSKKLEQINNSIQYIKKGLYSAFGKNLLKLLNSEQLEILICGKKEFNFEDFKGHTEYVGNGREVIKWFWEWLEEEENPFKYLRFVSGLSRLPTKKYKHTIILVELDNKKKEQYPKSHTCFFELLLPKYKSKEELRGKMDSAINNAITFYDE